MAKSMDFFLALSSPWTYMAGPRIAELSARTGVSVNWRPFNIVQIFGTTGVKPVHERPAQIQKNRLNELRRWREYLDIPLTLEPKFFPVNPFPAGKVVIAASLNGAPDAGALARAFMTACWAEERNIADEDTIAAIANEQGLDGKALLEASKGEAVEAAFEKNTADAVSHSVFGSPSFVYNGELFWGQDRIDFLARAIEKDS